MPQKKWNPADYDAQCVLQYNTSMNMLDTLLFKGNEKVLDVGCGTGKITFQIANQRLTKNGSITGIDINEKMIDFAKNKYKCQNLNFECSDVLKLDYEEEFDLAISFWTLSWISMHDQIDAIKTIIRSLKKDGHLFLMYPLKHDAYDVVSEVIKRPEWCHFFVNYSMPRAFITEEQYKEDILGNISMDIAVEKKEIECRYKDDEEMMSSINCWLAHVDEIPKQEDKDRFLKDVVIAYKKYRGITEPIMYYSILELTGCKLTLQNLHTCSM